jgi:cell division protein FtsQ
MRRVKPATTRAATRRTGRGGRTRVAPRRKRPAPTWLRPVRIWGTAALTLTFVIGGAVWLWQSGWVARTADRIEQSIVVASAGLGLTLQDVLLVGRHETTRNQIVAALDIKRGQPLLAFDPVAAKARLDALPWVRGASVERVLPDTVRVRIEERKPLALWQRNRKLVLVDLDGTVIRTRSLNRFRHLPLVVGDDAPRHAASLLNQLMREPKLLSRVTAAIRVAGRRWNLQLDNGIDVRLPAQALGAAWSRLAELEKEHGLLGRDLRVIDLRFPDRLVLRMAPGVAEQIRNPGKST